MNQVNHVGDVGNKTREVKKKAQLENRGGKRGEGLKDGQFPR